jgi:hypothetical protein
MLRTSHTSRLVGERRARKQSTIHLLGYWLSMNSENMTFIITISELLHLLGEEIYSRVFLSFEDWTLAE